MTVGVAILAAGSGVRFGGDKTLSSLGGRPVWRWSCDTFLAHPDVQRVVVVASEANVDAIRSLAPEQVEVVLGGATRQESSRIGIEACRDAEIVLIHDAARPFVSQGLIERVILATRQRGAAAPATPVADTIRQKDSAGLRIVDRQTLFAMQTPQAAQRLDLLRAHAAMGEATDDVALLETAGVDWELVPGEPNNFKITTQEDLARARSLIDLETRTGIGYDVHPFSSDPSKPLWLGGVLFEGAVGLEGHSDADVLLHAAVDAILGAVALGDIGEHFPNTDPRWKGEPSITFLRHAADLIGKAGWSVVNLDMTAIAETPKIMKRADAIRSAVASAIGVNVDRVSVKATTNERLGSIGRGEGIAAFAIATLKQSR